MTERVTFDNAAYQLALDAVETERRLDYLKRMVGPDKQQRVPFAPTARINYQEIFSQQLGSSPEIKITINKSIHENLTTGTPFPKSESDMFVQGGVSYSPEAYRSIHNYFVHLQRSQEINPGFGSSLMTYLAIHSLMHFGIISGREFDHLTRTDLMLVSNLATDLTSEKAYIANHKLFVSPEDVRTYAKVQAGRPKILLHGRFNSFPTAQYLHTIFSIITDTRFNEPPALIIRVDHDRSSIEWRNQSPFMNQVFRAGFYTFSPLVEAVFLAEDVDPGDYDPYWRHVYDEMEIDYLAIEESDPNKKEKRDRLANSTDGKGRILETKSGFEGAKRITSTEIKGDDPDAMPRIAAQWGDLMSKLRRYYSSRHPAYFEHGTRTPEQTPLFL